MPAPDRGLNDAINRELEREYDRYDLDQSVQTNVPLLNPKQKEVYDTLINAIDDENGGLFFLDAPEGTGKTFHMSLIFATILARSELRSDSHGESEEEASGGTAAASTGTKHKVVVMGAAKVGKSSIISQFLYNTYSPKYKRTVEEMHIGEFNVGGVRLTLEILDTAGSFEFPAMRALSISSGDAFILVYSAVDPETFEEVKAIRDQIIEIKGGSEVPIVIVGNKVDLIEDDEQQDSAKTFESIATVDWENGFVEASAKENLNCTQVFKELLTQAKVKYNLSPALRRRRRQSLPPAQAGAPVTPNPAIPSPAQLAHLQSLRERHGKRNSCVIS